MSDIEPEAKDRRDAGEDERDGSSDDDVLSETTVIHPLLRGDIERLRELEVYPGQFETLIMPSTAEMLLTMQIPTTVLSRSKAKTWKLIPEKPVIVRITLDPSLYLDAARCPEIDVLQPSAKPHGCGLLQLQRIATSFCESSFRSLSNEIVQSAVTDQTLQRESDTLEQFSLSDTGPVNRGSQTPDVESLVCQEDRDCETQSVAEAAGRFDKPCDDIPHDEQIDSQTPDGESLTCPEVSDCETQSVAEAAGGCGDSCENNPHDEQIDSQTKDGESLTCPEVSDCDTQSVAEAAGGCDDSCDNNPHDEQIDSQTPDGESLTCPEVSDCETQSVAEAAGGCGDSCDNNPHDEQIDSQTPDGESLTCPEVSDCETQSVAEAAGGCGDSCDNNLHNEQIDSQTPDGESLTCPEVSDCDTQSVAEATGGCDDSCDNIPHDEQIDSQTPDGESLTCPEVSDCDTQSVAEAAGGCDESCENNPHDEQIDCQTPDGESLTCPEVSECDTQSVAEAAGGCGDSCENIPHDEQMSVEDPGVQHLVSMGFHEDDAKTALRVSGGFVCAAAEILLDNEKRCQEAEVKSLEGADFGASELQIASQVPTDSGETMVDMISENNAAAFDLLGGQNEYHSPFTVPESPPSFGNGFLVQLFVYLRQRLPTLNGHCPVCDAALDRPHFAKPLPCDKELCKFHYQNFMLGRDRKVADLLFQLTKCAVLSRRSTEILSPFPALSYPTDPHDLDPQKRCKIDMLKTILQQMPPEEEWIGEEETYMQERLNSCHSLCYPLIEWIMQSNTACISAVPEGKQLDFIGTRHQFLLTYVDRDFEEKKKAHGSVFAFHGSPIENWHSIIREGLVVATGPARQLHGAVYGDAIYLSTSLSVSLHFSVGARTDRHQQERGANLTEENEDDEQAVEKLITGEVSCIALCEVIDDNLKKGQRTYACRQGENVCIRMLFVYDALNPPSLANLSADTRQFSVYEKIVNTL